MKRCIIFVLFAVLSNAGSLHALLIAEETFNYPVGALSGNNGGVGFSGGWFLSPLVSSDNHVATPGLSHASIPGSGGRMVENAGDVRSFRRIDTARVEVQSLLDAGQYGKTFGKDNTTVWVAFLISCASYPTVAYGGMHLCDGLGDLTLDQFGDKLAHQRVSLGRQNTDIHWYLGRVTNGGPGAGTYLSSTVADATLRLLVYRFDFKPGPEEAWMWIDPPAGAAPDTALAAIHATGVTDFRFNTLSCGTGGSARFDFDEVRFGTAYQDVVPPASRIQFYSPATEKPVLVSAISEGQVRFLVNLASPGPFTLAVHDVTGARLWNSEGGPGSGIQSVGWSPEHTVGSGTYVVTLRSPGILESKLFYMFK